MKDTKGCRNVLHAFAVIPAKAGIQEGRPGGLMDGRVYRMARWVVVPVIVIPALREWIESTTGFQLSLE